MHPLEREILELGSITLERFMGFALHDPQHGYYARRARTVGARGDFSTSVSLSPLLARAVAAWARRRRPGGLWHFVELGGGDGSFARDFLRELGWWGRRRCTYHFVEIGERLREAQGLALEGRAHWHTTMEAALTAAGGEALVFGNEFIDALPCAVLERTGESDPWEEIGLAWPLREVRRPARAELLDSSSTSLRLVSGRVEVHLAARAWLQALARSWRRGALLLIDYGGTAAECYHRRPRGTLRGYFRQQRVEGAEIYERIGHQDLTAEVNFEDLARWAGESGLRVGPRQTQREFLLPHAGKAPPAADQFLLDPDGAGGAFQVLEIGR